MSDIMLRRAPDLNTLRQTVNRKILKFLEFFIVVPEDVVYLCCERVMGNTDITENW